MQVLAALVGALVSLLFTALLREEFRRFIRLRLSLSRALHKKAGNWVGLIGARGLLCLGLVQVHRWGPLDTDVALWVSALVLGIAVGSGQAHVLERTNAHQNSCPGQPPPWILKLLGHVDTALIRNLIEHFQNQERRHVQRLTRIEPPLRAVFEKHRMEVVDCLFKRRKEPTDVLFVEAGIDGANTWIICEYLLEVMSVPSLKSEIRHTHKRLAKGQEAFDGVDRRDPGQSAVLRKGMPRQLLGDPLDKYIRRLESINPQRRPAIDLVVDRLRKIRAHQKLAPRDGAA